LGNVQIVEERCISLNNILVAEGLLIVLLVNTEKKFKVSNMKKKKFRVWTHIDSGIGQIVEAEDDLTAIEIADSRLDNDEFKKQIRDNLQFGKTEIIEELSEDFVEE
jgi:hypothetical protein